MKFLLLMGPTIRFIINRYSPKITIPTAALEVVQKFYSGTILNPAESKQFGKILSDIKSYLIENKVDFKISTIKTYIGNGPNWKGALYLIADAGHEIYIYAYAAENIKNFTSQLEKITENNFENIRIIAPLNMYDSQEIAKFFHGNLNLPLYPLIHNIMTSKLMLSFIFAPYIPRTFYFPEGTSAIDFQYEIYEIAQKEKIEWLFLKDEFDSDNSGMVPYTITPIKMMEQFCTSFYEHIQGISNIGGLLLEEFLVEKDIIHIYKGYIFKGIYKKPLIYLKTFLKSYEEGCLFKTVLKETKEEFIECPRDLFEKFDGKFSYFFPYLFSSFDYIMQNNVPRIIDINSTANIWDFAQKHEKLDLNGIFVAFINQILNENNEEAFNKQREIWYLQDNLYENLKKLGPCYINGEKVIRLIGDKMEYNIKELIDDIINGETKVISFETQMNQSENHH